MADQPVTAVKVSGLRLGLNGCVSSTFTVNRWPRLTIS